jgi:hypothetical protein
MTRTGDIDHVQVVFFDHAVEVDIDKVQARSRPPVSQQSRFDVFQREGFFEEGIIEEIDLSDGQIICGPPIGVHGG